MTIETEIAGLTQATTDLLDAVNVRKAALDEKVSNADAFAQASLTSANNAEASAATANTKAGEGAGYAAQALAIYGNTEAMQTAVAQAAAQASVAAGHAASASSVVQQDLSGVNAAALHRSPNAVTAMFVYDTGKDSDGGAWTEKCQHTSWYNETINGKWLGAQASEFNARYEGSTLGADIVNGGFDTDTAWTKGSGWVISNGSARIPSGASPSITQVSPTTLSVGDVVKVTFTISAIATGIVYILIAGNLTNNNAEQFAGSGTYTRFVTVSGVTDQTIGLLVGNGPTGIVIDNVSIRKVTAIATAPGDYYQSTVDGKFYKLNATSGTTEVFRGNKRDFPRLAAIVAEAASVTIYDLTEPGRPMWMRFVASGTTAYATARALLGPNSQSAVFALNGVLTTGATSNNGYQGSIINFPADRVPFLTNGAAGSFLGNIARRNEALGFSYVGGYGTIPSTSINAIAMTVLPDAPVDPATGLQVPTIAVATGGSLSIIKHNGYVVNSSSTGPFNKVAISPYQVSTAGSATSFYYAQNPGSLGSAFSLQTATAEFGRGIVNILKNPQRSDILRTSGALLTKRRNNESLPGSSIHSTITDVFNTGHMTGDIRRAYLADVDVGSVSGTELVTNGDFSTPDLTGWSSNDSGAAISVVDGRLQYQPLNCNTTLRLTVPLVIGKTYLAMATFQKGTNANTHGYSLFGVGGLLSQNDPFVVTAVFTATATSGTIELSPYACSNGTSFVDSVSVKEIVADRSYKAKVASITGTLTKSSVATGSQLVAYSGFSA